MLVRRHEAASLLNVVARWSQAGKPDFAAAVPLRLAAVCAYSRHQFSIGSADVVKEVSVALSLVLRPRRVISHTVLAPSSLRSIDGPQLHSTGVHMQSKGFFLLPVR